MPDYESIDMKYLLETSNGIKVKISRADKKYEEDFSFRSNGGYKRTLKVAQENRNKAHLELFGIEVTKGFTHVKKKRNSLDKDLPPGISHGYSRGKLIYITVNFMKNKKPTRKRYNINKLGYEKAFKEATNFRKKVISKIP